MVLNSLEDIIDKFWTLDFPSLKYLVLYQWNSTESGLLKVQNWCLRHQAHLGQITFLNEDMPEECGLAFTAHESGGQIGLGVRSLIGPPHHLLQMVNLHLNLLRPSLQTIIIDPILLEYESTYSSLDEALTHILAQATPEHSLFPHLKEITITECPLYQQEVWYPQDLDHYLNWVVRWTQLSRTALEHWTGPVPQVPELTPEMVGSAFSEAPNLKMIRIINMEMMEAEEIEKLEEYATRLASQCPSLETVELSWIPPPHEHLVLSVERQARDGKAMIAKRRWLRR
jgi:hypothetical protein